METYGEVTTESYGDVVTGRGAFGVAGVLAWAAVGIPIAWGVYRTLSKAVVLFSS